VVSSTICEPRPDDRRRIQFWRPDKASVTGMFRIEREDRLKATYIQDFWLVVVYDGAFDGWYRGGVRTYGAGTLQAKEPGEIRTRGCSAQIQMSPFAQDA
jgi:hypothetical protein